MDLVAVGVRGRISSRNVCDLKPSEAETGAFGGCQRRRQGVTRGMVPVGRKKAVTVAGRDASGPRRRSMPDEWLDDATAYERARGI